MKRRDEDGALARELAALAGTSEKEAEDLVGRVRDALDEDDLRLSDERRATMHTQARAILERRAAAKRKASAADGEHGQQKEVKMNAKSMGAVKNGALPPRWEDDDTPPANRKLVPAWLLPVVGVAAALGVFLAVRAPTERATTGAGGLAGAGRTGTVTERKEGAWSTTAPRPVEPEAPAVAKSDAKSKSPAIAGTWETGAVAAGRHSHGFGGMPAAKPKPMPLSGLGGSSGGLGAGGLGGTGGAGGPGGASGAGGSSGAFAGARSGASSKASEGGSMSGINLDTLGTGLGKISSVEGADAGVASGLSTGGEVKGIARRAPRAEQTREEGNILTAGVFDDARNPEIFARYVMRSPVASVRPFKERDWKRLAKPFPTRPARKLQLAFVFDTTGSMGDELSFLQREFRSIVASVRKRHPDVAQEYALILYRDQGDEYVTRGIQLTPDVDEFTSFLSQQVADGGGDTPEAADEALRDAHERLAWDSSNDTARLLFWIGDAPPHAHRIAASLGHADALAKEGVRVYPVAASGVDDTAEAVFRTTAYVTGGQYIFLTDDSGVGDPHAKPKFPCYFVEKLKGLVIRSVSDVVAGRRTFPRSSDLIRTVGAPAQDGRCPNTESFLRELGTPHWQTR